MLKMRTLLPKFLPHYFLLAETKLDEGFQNCRFIIDQYVKFEHYRIEAKTVRV